MWNIQTHDHRPTDDHDNKKTGLVVNGFVCHFITSPMDMMTSLLMHTWNRGCEQAATMWTEYTADVFSWIVECK